jgi:hypothetical protein
MVVMPTAFDKHDQCTAAIAEYKKQPVPTGWSIECVPSASPYADDLGDDEPSLQEAPAQ